jgi:hypothetical protein
VPLVTQRLFFGVVSNPALAGESRPSRRLFLSEFNMLSIFIIPSQAPVKPKKGESKKKGDSQKKSDGSSKKAASQK